MANTKPNEYKMDDKLAMLIGGFSGNLNTLKQAGKANPNEPLAAQFASDADNWYGTAMPAEVADQARFLNAQMGNNFFDHYLPKGEWDAYCGAFYEPLDVEARMVALDFTAKYSDPRQFKNKATQQYVGIYHRQRSVDDLLDGAITEQDLQELAGHFMVPKILKVEDGKPVYEMDGDQPKFELHPSMENIISNFGGPNSESVRGVLAMKGRAYNIEREAILESKRTTLERDLATKYEGGQAGLLKATAIQAAYQAANQGN